jgi:hypothetical protein
VDLNVVVDLNVAIDAVVVAVVCLYEPTVLTSGVPIIARFKIV